jgi:hypothetical protein
VTTCPHTRSQDVRRPHKLRDLVSTTGAAHFPSIVRNYNTPKVRCSATLREEPDSDVELGWTLRAHALLMELHATDVVGSSAYSKLDSPLLPWTVSATLPSSRSFG